MIIPELPSEQLARLGERKEVYEAGTGLRTGHLATALAATNSSGEMQNAAIPFADERVVDLVADLYAAWLDSCLLTIAKSVAVCSPPGIVRSVGPRIGRPGLHEGLKRSCPGTQ